MSERIEHIALVPLVNFDSDVDLIQLDENLCVRRLDKDEWKNLKESAPFLKEYSELDALFSVDAEFVIERRWQIGESPLWRENSPYVIEIVLALRLLKPSDVTTPTALHSTSTHKSYGISNPSPIYWIGASCFLRKNEISNFKKLWKRIQKVKEEKPYLEFPLQQFQKTFEESSGSIVHFMTAFESIVFHRGETTPRPYGRAIGIAIGMLLGKNEEERTEIEKNLKEAYEVRNAIVHGHLREKLQKYDDEHATQLVLKTEDYLRRTLRRLVEE